jgi:hypothetical protein
VLSNLSFFNIKSSVLCNNLASPKNAYDSMKKYIGRKPLWSSGQSSWLQNQRSRVSFPWLPDLLSSSGSGAGRTWLREYK